MGEPAILLTITGKQWRWCWSAEQTIA